MSYPGVEGEPCFGVKWQHMIFGCPPHVLQMLVFCTLDGTLQIRDQRLRDHDHGPDRELQNRPLSANHDLKKKLCNFSRKTVQFLVIANCRNGPLSAMCKS